MFSRNITRSVSLKFWKPAAKPLAPTVGPVTSDFADDHRVCEINARLLMILKLGLSGLEAIAQRNWASKG